MLVYGVGELLSHHGVENIFIFLMILVEDDFAVILLFYLSFDFLLAIMLGLLLPKTEGRSLNFGVLGIA